MKYGITKTIDIITYETCKLALTPHEKKISLFMVGHYSIQLAHLSASSQLVTVVTVLGKITRLMRLENYYRVTGGHYLYFEQVDFVTCFVVDGFVQLCESSGKCWMFAVTRFHRILQWTWIGRDLWMADPLKAGLASNADQWRSVLAYLNQAVWSLGWRLCSHSGRSVLPIPTQPASHPVGISAVVTCGCCFLSFRCTPQGSISSVVPHWV